MGLFFRKKKNLKGDTKESLNPSAKVFLADGDSSSANSADMVSLIKSEQKDKEIVNPFVESAPTVAQKSVAKRYGDKYVGMAGKQIASSIVVDVRSYVKPESFKNVSKLFEDEEPKEKEEKKTSFFDEIMKSLEENDDEKSDIFDDDEEEKSEPEPEPEVKLPPKKSEAKASNKNKKKRVDIDIISGDFGGTDII